MDTYDDRLAAAYIRAANDNRTKDAELLAEAREHAAEESADREALNLMRRITNAVEGVEEVARKMVQNDAS